MSGGGCSKERVKERTHEHGDEDGDVQELVEDRGALLRLARRQPARRRSWPGRGPRRA